MIEDIKEWHKIGNRLTSYLHICSCQRKLKSIVEIMLRIQSKFESGYLARDLTPEELLICNLLDANSDVITHGTNCEYPILGHAVLDKHDNLGFWEWLKTIKDNPNLIDN